MKPKIVIAGVIILSLGVILLLVLLNRSQDNRSHASDEQIQDSLSLQKKDVSMSISTATGPVGTPVAITISSKISLANATLTYNDDEGSNATTMIKLKDLTPTITNGLTTYQLTYVIPKDVVVQEDVDDEKTEPITLGTGRFVLNYNEDQSPTAIADDEKIIQIPFTLTKQ